MPLYSPGGGGSAGGILTVEREFTSEELKALNTTPIEMIAAPGAGKVAIPLFGFWRTVVSSSMGANPTVRLRWAGSTIELGPNVNMPLNSTGTAYRGGKGVPTDFSFDEGTFDPRNKAVQISLSTDLAQGAGTAVVTVAYYVADLS